MTTQRVEDQRMVAASETAARNPMRPPDTLPRDGRSAFRYFAAHPSPILITLFIVILGSWRIALGHFGWGDALLALGLVAYFPINEWVIHVFMLHYRPRKVLGKTVDFQLPKYHRRHHADPWNMKWVFIPRTVHVMTVPQVALILWLLWPWKELALTGLTAYLLLGLNYEWAHFLAHIPWGPTQGIVGRYYQRRVREHRYHHFRNENYWWGVSMGMGDRVFGTAPAVEDIGRSGTTSDIATGKSLR